MAAKARKRRLSKLGFAIWLTSLLGVLEITCYVVDTLEERQFSGRSDINTFYLCLVIFVLLAALETNVCKRRLRSTRLKAVYKFSLYLLAATCSWLLAFVWCFGLAYTLLKTVKIIASSPAVENVVPYLGILARIGMYVPLFIIIYEEDPNKNYYGFPPDYLTIRAQERKAAKLVATLSDSAGGSLGREIGIRLLWREGFALDIITCGAFGLISFATGLLFLYFLFVTRTVRAHLVEGDWRSLIDWVFATTQCALFSLIAGFVCSRKAYLFSYLNIVKTIEDNGRFCLFLRPFSSDGNTFVVPAQLGSRIDYKPVTYTVKSLIKLHIYELIFDSISNFLESEEKAAAKATSRWKVFLEHFLSTELEAMKNPVPTVCLGLNEHGPMQMVTDDADWEKQFERLADRAAFLVFVIGLTQGSMRELDCIKTKYVSKTLFVFFPARLSKIKLADAWIAIVRGHDEIDEHHRKQLEGLCTEAGSFVHFSSFPNAYVQAPFRVESLSMWVEWIDSGALPDCSPFKLDTPEGSIDPTKAIPRPA